MPFNVCHFVNNNSIGLRRNILLLIDGCDNRRWKPINTYQVWNDEAMRNYLYKCAYDYDLTMSRVRDGQ